MSRVKSTGIACATVFLLAAGSEAQTQTQTPTRAQPQVQTRVPEEASLYQRIGGYDTIARMVDDFFERMGNDERLQRLFLGFSDSSMRRIRQLTVDFICAESGGPCFYTGRSMAVVHEGSGITEEDWERASVLMGETLDMLGVQGELREEVGGFVSGLRGDIVGQE